MDQQKKNILILDGGHKKTLAIVRSIGKSRKYILDVGASNKRAITYFSRYTGHRILFPNPRKEPEQYKTALINILKIKPYLTIIPTDSLSFQLCAEIKEEINTLCHISIMDADSIKKAGDKGWTYEMAKSLGIPVPETVLLDIHSNMDRLKPGQQYVLKSPLESGDNYLEFAANKEAVIDLAKKYFQNSPKNILLAQKRILGDGYGFFAFYKNGICQNHFVHHRLREYPPSGGYSVAAEGFRDPEIIKLGKKILDHLEWEGVAMVEFKKDLQTNEYNLLEINAKFWGSIELAIINGVDFPQMWIDDAMEMDIKKVKNYSISKFQWLLNGELFHALEKPSNLGKILTDLLYAKNDIWLIDLKPNLFQLANIPMHYYKKWKR